MVHIAVLDSGCRKDVGVDKKPISVFSCNLKLRDRLSHRLRTTDLICVENPDCVDSFGHGTSVHLCITQLAPWASIDHFTVLNESGTGNPELLCAVLNYVIGLKKHQIINMSLGLQDSAWILPLVGAMRSAYENNIAIVAASNNLGALPYPAQFTYPLCCKAIYTEDAEKLVWFPNSVVEFGARGVHIPLQLSQNETHWVSGSSFAAAHLTGICANLLKSNRSLKPLQLKAQLIEISEKIEK